jgi:hypothetical protein
VDAARAWDDFTDRLCYAFGFCDGIGLQGCGSEQKVAFIAPTAENGNLSDAAFDPGTDWHTYRFEVRASHSGSWWTARRWSAPSYYWPGAVATT